MAVRTGETGCWAGRPLLRGNRDRTSEARDAYQTEKIASYRLSGLAIAEPKLGRIEQAQAAYDGPDRFSRLLNELSFD